MYRPLFNPLHHFDLMAFKIDRIYRTRLVVVLQYESRTLYSFHSKKIYRLDCYTPISRGI